MLWTFFMYLFWMIMYNIQRSFAMVLGALGYDKSMMGLANICFPRCSVHP